MDVDARQPREVLDHAVVGVDQEGDGESEPHQPVPEKRLDERPIGVILHHGDGQLRHRKDETLPFDPLFAQNHHDRDHGQVHRQGQRHPTQDRRQPEAPGHASGRALVQILDLLQMVGGDQPGGNMRQQVRRPAVFGRGVVDRAGELGQEIGDEAVGGDGRADDHHDIDLRQLGRAQHPAATQQSDEGIHAEDDEQEKDQGARRVEPACQPGPLQHHVRVLGPRAYQEAAHNADEQGAVAGPQQRSQSCPPLPPLTCLLQAAIIGWSVANIVIIIIAVSPSLGSNHW